MTYDDYRKEYHQNTGDYFYWITDLVDQLHRKKVTQREFVRRVSKQTRVTTDKNEDALELMRKSYEKQQGRIG